MNAITKEEWNKRIKELECLAKNRVTSITILRELKYMKQIEAIEMKNK